MLIAAALAMFLIAVAPAQATPFAYVTNGVGDTVSQYEVGTGGRLAPLSPPTVTAHIPLSIAVSPDGASVYVSGADSVSQYDVGPAGALAPKSPPAFAAGNNLRGVAVSPNGRSVYVVDYGQYPFTSPGSVLQYDVGPGGVLSPKSPATVAAGRGAEAIAMSPNGHSVYVTNFEYHTVSQFDVGPGGALTPKSPSTVVAGLSPEGIAVSPDGRSVYVANAGDDNVSQYDVRPGGALSPKSPATIGAGDYPDQVAVSPDGRSVYVTNQFGNNVSQYNVRPGGALSPKSPATTTAGRYPSGIAVSPDDRSVYVVNWISNNVSQYDVGPRGALSPKSPAKAATGESSLSIAVSPLGQLETTITGGPSGVTNDPTPTFWFFASKPGSSFQCRLDSGPYSSCSSPSTTKHLPSGRHTFYVRAKGPAGHVDPTPALRTFTVRP